jgi:hypothetical protein
LIIDPASTLDLEQRLQQPLSTPQLSIRILLVWPVDEFDAADLVLLKGFHVST